MAIAINILGSALGILLSLAPLPWYGKTHNIPNIVLAFWLFFINIFLFANAITWGGNTNINHVEYCDFATKLMIGFLFAMPTSTLLTTFQHRAISKICELDMGKRKWKRRLLEGLASAAVPFVFMLLHLAVQDHRFDIIEGYGCMPSVFPSYAAIFLIWVPLMLLSVAAIIVNMLTFKHMLHCPSYFTLEAHLDWKESQYTRKHIIREFVMTSIHAALSLTLAITAMAFYGHDGVHPFPSLAVVHKDVHTVFTFSTEDLKRGFPDGLGSPIFVWWIAPIATFVFFTVNFGDAERAACVRFFRWVAHVPPKRKLEDIRKGIPFFAPEPERDFDDYTQKYVSHNEMRRRAKEAKQMKLQSRIRGQARMRSARLAELKRKQGNKSTITQDIDAALTDFPPGYRAWEMEYFGRIKAEDPTLKRAKKLKRRMERQKEMQEMAARKAEERAASKSGYAPTAYPPGYNYEDDYKMSRLQFDFDVDNEIRPLPDAYLPK